MRQPGYHEATHIKEKASVSKKNFFCVGGQVELLAISQLEVDKGNLASIACFVKLNFEGLARRRLLKLATAVNLPLSNSS